MFKWFKKLLFWRKKPEYSDPAQRLLAKWAPVLGYDEDAVKLKTKDYK